jgi:hypothetical protein
MADESGKLVSQGFMRDMAEIKKRVLGSSRTRSSKFRRRRNPGGGGGGGGAPPSYRVKTRIPAAAGNNTARWGTGEGDRLDDASGLQTGEFVTLVNRTSVSYEVDTQVWDLGNGLIVGKCGPEAIGYWFAG